MQCQITSRCHERERESGCVCVVVSVFVSNEKRKTKNCNNKKILPFKNAIPSEPKLAYEKKESEFFSEFWAKTQRPKKREKENDKRKLIMHEVKESTKDWIHANQKQPAKPINVKQKNQNQ